MNNSNIHSTSIIYEGAVIGSNAIIGPYSIIGPEVIIGDNNVIKSHTVITGRTIIGNNNQIFPFACIGEAPQDKKFAGEKSELIIGDNNIIREYVTINPGTKQGGMITKVGNNNLLMASVHIAHDCIIGNNIVLANNATLAGHVQVDDYAQLGGLSAVHQFTRIGSYAMIGGMAGIEGDVIPYGVAINKRANLIGINITGLKRAKFERKSINNILKAYEKLFEDNEQNYDQRIINIADEFKNDKHVKNMINFLQIDTTRAICKPKK